MKKLFAVFMSLHLILAPVAFAQEVPEDKYNTEGSGGKGGYDFVANQVLNIATSTIGANIFTQCYQAILMPSIATFMAGSLVNVIAEIAGAKRKNERDQLKMKDLKELEATIKNEKDSSQVSSMEALLTAEEENLEYIESRKKWTLATSVIYAASAGLAIAEEVYGNSTATTAAATACTAQGTAAASCAEPYVGVASANAAELAISAPVAAVAAAAATATAALPGPLGAAAAATAAGTGASTAAASTATATTAIAACTTACSTAATAAAAIPFAAAVAASTAAACAAAIPLAVTAATTACSAGTAFMIAQEKAIEASPGISGARAVVTSGCTPFTPYSAGCFAQGNVYLTSTWGACAFISPDGNAAPMLMGALLIAAYGFGNKSGGEISTYGSMAAGLIQSLIPAVGKTVVLAYSSAIPRSFTFGASAALAGVITLGLEARANQTIKNIVALKNAIAQLKKQTSGDESGVGEVPINDEKNTNAAKTKKYDVKKLSIQKKVECLAKSSNSWTHSESSCSRSFKLSKTKFGNFKLPALTKVGALASDMAQSLINGDENGAAKLGDEIGSYAARVKKETEALQKIYNQGEQKAKRPAKDFNKSLKAQYAAMQAQVQQAAKANGVNLNSMASTAPSVPNDESNSTVPEVTTTTAPEAIVPQTDPLGGISTSETPEIDTVAVPSKAEQSLEDYESTVQDISKQPEVSIFKLLSNRYILNYTKMFNLKKAEAIPVSEDPPKN